MDEFESVFSALTDDVVLLDWDSGDASGEINAKINGFIDAMDQAAEKYPEKCLEKVLHFMEIADENSEAVLEYLGIEAALLNNKGIAGLVADESYGIKKRAAFLLGANNAELRNDEIFAAAKALFKSSEGEDRLYIAILLGDYGDSRAIPMLRRIAIQYTDKADEATAAKDQEAYRNAISACSLLVRAIKTLGGETRDFFPEGMGPGAE